MALETGFFRMREMGGSVVVSYPLEERAERLKAAIRVSGTNFAAMAREIGVSQVILTNVCKGARRSLRVEAMIAERIGCTPEMIWPEHHRDGKAD